MSGNEESDNSGEGKGWESENLESSGDDYVPGRDESSSESLERDKKRKGVEGVKRQFKFEEGGMGRRAKRGNLA